MKNLPGMLLATALACGANTNAWAYHFSPPYVSAKLHGKLTFTPNEGGTPFTCGVTLDLKTKTSKITTVKFPGGDCEAVRFQSLPWYVHIDDANSGRFSFEGFTSGKGICAADVLLFEDNASGVWTLPTGQCLSGTLSSRPPVTIVP